MQTPEGYVVGMFGPCDKSGLYGGCSAHESVWEVGERCRWMRNFADLIRARDAEVRADERARVLAGFEVERADRMVARRVPCDCPGDWQHHGRFVGDDGPETHARFDVVPSRRLVGPWEPNEGDA